MNMKQAQNQRAKEKFQQDNAIIENISIKVDMRTGQILDCKMPVMPSPVAMLMLLNKCQELLMNAYDCSIKKESPILKPKSRIIVPKV